jgi:hypothetical protein
MRALRGPVVLAVVVAVLAALAWLLFGGGCRSCRSSARMPGTLRGRVLVNGEPWASKSVSLSFEYDVPMLREGRGPDGFGGMKTGDSAQALRTEALGIVEGQLTAGGMLALRITAPASAGY